MNLACVLNMIFNFFCFVVTMTFDIINVFYHSFLRPCHCVEKICMKNLQKASFRVLWNKEFIRVWNGMNASSLNDEVHYESRTLKEVTALHALRIQR